MSLVCEISGQRLFSSSSSSEDTTKNEQVVVVTPSGHVCLKHLLLTKLSENGGLDPFLTPSQKVPLEESQCVVMKPPAASTSSPPSFATFHDTLVGLQKEYDNLVLELFDTRQQLQETRQQLSQALYQNDASIRVIARLSQERDVAKQQLQQWKLAAPTAAVEDDAEGPSKKRPRTEETTTTELPLKNDIPAGDLQAMLTTWEELHKTRKSSKKKKGTPEVSLSLDNADESITTVSCHKTSCKGISTLASCCATTANNNNQQYLVTAGIHDKQIIIYDTIQKVISYTISDIKQPITFMDSFSTSGGEVSVVAVTGGDDEEKKQQIRYYHQDQLQHSYDHDNKKDPIVFIGIHPTGQHVVAATQNRTVLIFQTANLQLISTFTAEKSDDDDDTYTCGAIHPDGLLFAVGSQKGNVSLWDFKNKVLASTLSSEDKGAVSCIGFSNNGYHVSTVHDKKHVLVWDLRKQKIITELNNNTDEEKLEQVGCVSFDTSGKYLAYGGGGDGNKDVVHITTVKEWGMTAKLQKKEDGDGPVNGIVWSHNTLDWMATSSDTMRTMTFYHKKKESTEG